MKPRVKKPGGPRGANRQAGYLVAAERLRSEECWRWFLALYAFDHGDPKPLASQVAGDAAPPEFRAALADIVAGRRVPNRKARAKFKVAPLEMAKLAATASTYRGVIHDIRHRGSDPYTTELGAAALADAKGLEPHELVRVLGQARERLLATCAAAAGVSTKALMAHVREIDARIARWPLV